MSIGDLPELVVVLHELQEEVNDHLSRDPTLLRSLLVFWQRIVVARLSVLATPDETLLPTHEVEIAIKIGT